MLLIIIYEIIGQENITESAAVVMEMNVDAEVLSSQAIPDLEI